MTEANMAELCGVHQTRDLFAQDREHAAESGVEQQWLVIPYQEMAELQIDLRNKNRDPEHIFCDFCCTDHTRHLYA